MKLQWAQYWTVVGLLSTEQVCTVGIYNYLWIMPIITMCYLVGHALYVMHRNVVPAFKRAISYLTFLDWDKPFFSLTSTTVFVMSCGIYIHWHKLLKKYILNWQEYITIIQSMYEKKMIKRRIAFGFWSFWRISSTKSVHLKTF